MPQKQLLGWKYSRLFIEKGSPNIKYMTFYFNTNGHINQELI